MVLRWTRHLQVVADGVPDDDAAGEDLGRLALDQLERLGCSEVRWPDAAAQVGKIMQCQGQTYCRIVSMPVLGILAICRRRACIIDRVQGPRLDSKTASTLRCAAGLPTTIAHL